MVNINVIFKTEPNCDPTSLVHEQASGRRRPVQAESRPAGAAAEQLQRDGHQQGLAGSMFSFLTLKLFCSLVLIIIMFVVDVYVNIILLRTLLITRLTVFLDFMNQPIRNHYVLNFFLW